MSRRILIAYQLLTGFSDSSTGAMLQVAPAFTLRIMGLRAPADALEYIGFIGAFVFSVGLSCLYGAVLARIGGKRPQLEMVWLLTAFGRASVAVFVTVEVLAGKFETGWLTVALVDAACVLIQAIGLHKGWLADAA